MEPHGRGHSRERKVRRSESSVPPERSPSDGLRRPAHHFAAPCPPTVFPPRESPLPSVGLSPVGPPKRPSPCGCCTYEPVLCTRPVATRATLGCSRVARFAAIDRPPPNGRCPAGRRLPGDWGHPFRRRTPGPRTPDGLEPSWPGGPASSGHGRSECCSAQPALPRASIAPRRPSTAQESGNPGTRVARRTQFRSKDPS
jgi:hypothetical protein